MTKAVFLAAFFERKHMFRIGDIVADTYRLTEVIGHGGMGIIYKAYHLRLQKYVVLKKIKDNYVGVVNKRAEVDLLKKLHHSYLPQVYDFLQIGREVFTVMEFIDGVSLDVYLSRNQTINESQIMRWLTEMLEALNYLHNQKPAIYHNDIKPGNIMITQDGHACLIDFNISLEETDRDRIIGLSKNFASPEQKKKAEMARRHQYHENIVIDGRSDIYSLGKTFRYVTKKGVYTSGLNNVLKKATHSEKNARFKNAGQMLEAVKNIQRYDDEYQKYRYRAIVCRSIYGLLIILGFLCVYAGFTVNVREDFETDSEKLAALQKQSNNSEVVQLGVGILNSFYYAALLRHSPADKAQILYAVGKAYENEEKHSEAIRYFDEAIKCDGIGNQKKQYLRDCAIAYAHNDDVDKAQSLLAEAENEGLDTGEAAIINGEIAYSNGNQNKAIEFFDEAVKKATSNQTKTDALRRKAKVYNETGTYYKAANCYEDIVKSSDVTFIDQMNLAIDYEFIGKYDDGESLLLDLLKDNKDDYRVYMCLTRIEMKLGKRDQAKSYYQQAKSLYEKSGKDGSDENMEKLIDDME